MTLYKSNFLRIYQMSEIDALKIKWHENSKDMNNEEFKVEIFAEKQVIESVRPKLIFADTLEMNFTISPDLQEWHNAQIFPAFQLANVQKLAILVSKHIFSQVSIEQLIEDGSHNKMLINYFDEEQKAIDWLKH